MGKTRLDTAENMAGQACDDSMYILQKTLCRQDHSQYLSLDCVLAWVPKKSITWHVQEASLAVPLASVWQSTKYPQGHRHLPYFTVNITTRCWSPPKKALVFVLSALCGLHEIDSAKHVGPACPRHNCTGNI